MEQQLKPYFFLSLFVLVIGLNIYLFLPFFHTFAFASIIAGVFYPFFKFLESKKNFNTSRAALVATFFILLTVILPSIYLGAQLSKETYMFYQSVATDLNRDFIKAQFVGDGLVASAIEQVLAALDISMTKEEVYSMAIEKAQSYLGGVLNLVNSFLGNVLNLIFQFILMIIIVYSIFIFGGSLKEYFFKLSPLPEEQEQKILDRFNQMNYVTLVGNGIGGVIQGVLAGLAFWVCGLPSVFLWTTVMIILAFIPLVGMSIIFIPASLYLVIAGKTATGVALFIWCGVVSLVVENIYKPKFVGDRVQVNGILLLFYIIAGMGVFGAPGLFYGPILCIIFLTVSEMFTSYYLKEATTL